MKSAVWKGWWGLFAAALSPDMTSIAKCPGEEAGLGTVELDLTQSEPEDVISVIEQLGYRASPLP